MKLNIGILAHNESGSIGVLLRSLCQQSLLIDGEHQVEIVIVPNGCKDNTAAVSRQILEQLAPQHQAFWTWRVCEVEEAGKSNAWNLFIHEFAAPDANFFYLIDADIQLLDPTSLTKMLEVLIDNPDYWIALDRPIKDVELKEQKSWLEKLSVAVSKSSNDGQLYICGQLYCARAEPLRKIWMPAGLPVEDGFLTQMIIRENFTIDRPTFSKRIVRVNEASHVFEAYTNPFELVNHEVRVVMGIVINIFLTYYLRDRCSRELTAGTLIARMNRESHFWLNDFVRNYLSNKQWWIIPISLVFRRYSSLKSHSLRKACLRVPIATLAFIVDLSIFVRANRKLHREVISNYW